jgi:hypothetical protein
MKRSPDSVAQVVKQGYVLLAELLLRRSSVVLNSEDEELMAWVLDAIRARLKFLERPEYLCPPLTSDLYGCRSLGQSKVLEPTPSLLNPATTLDSC